MSYDDTLFVTIADPGGYQQVVRGSTIPATPSFVPPGNNSTDAGSASHQFKTLYLGTGIANLEGGLDFDCVAPATLSSVTMGNSGAAGTFRLRVNGEVNADNINGYSLDCSGTVSGGDIVSAGGLSYSTGTAFSFTLAGIPTVDRVIRLPDTDGDILVRDLLGSIALGGNTFFDYNTGANRTFQVYNTNVLGNVTVKLGAKNTDFLAFYDGTGSIQAANVPAATDLVSAITLLNAVRAWMIGVGAMAGPL